MYNFRFSTDASLANARKGRTQAGHVTGAASSRLDKNEISPWSITAWKSGHLKRNVESTLGSETQLLLRGIKELEWIKGLWTEMHKGIADLENRHPSFKKQESLATTHCKSAYDALTGIASTAISDRTTAFDAILIKPIMMRANVKMRWVPGSLQLANSMTKDQAGACDALRPAKQDARYAIADEQEMLRSRALEKKRRLEIRKGRAEEAMSKTKIKECEIGFESLLRIHVGKTLASGARLTRTVM